MSVLFVVLFAGYSLHPYALHDEYKPNEVFYQEHMTHNKYLNTIDMDLYKDRLHGCSLELIMNKDHGSAFNISTRTDGNFINRELEKIPIRFNGTSTYAQSYGPDECQTMVDSMYLLSLYDTDINVMVFNVEVPDPPCNMSDLLKSDEIIQIHPAHWSSNIPTLRHNKRVMLHRCEGYDFADTPFYDFAYGGIPEVEPILSMNNIHRLPVPLGITKMHASHAFSDSKAIVTVEHLCGPDINITLEGTKLARLWHIRESLGATVTRMRIKILRPFPEHSTIKLYGKQAMLRVDILSTNGVSDIKHPWTTDGLKSQVLRQGKDKNGMMATEAILYISGSPILFCHV